LHYILGFFFRRNPPDKIQQTAAFTLNGIPDLSILFLGEAYVSLV
jgi:hypothetical protein